jgi:hypothetical protein
MEGVFVPSYSSFERNQLNTIGLINEKKTSAEAFSPKVFMNISKIIPSVKPIISKRKGGVSKGRSIINSGAITNCPPKGKSS